jgi:threonine synthase
VGVQSSACAPLAHAIEKNLSPAEVLSHPVEVGHTIAGAIADDILFDAYTAIPAVKNTGGLALTVSDEEMLMAEEMLARSSGLFAEPSSAATVAALKKCIDSKTVAKSDVVCCIITGSGFKDMDSAKKLVGKPTMLEPTEEAFLKLPN